MDQKTSDALTIASDLVKELQNAGIRLERAYLYGSHAIGGARPDSDINVAIVSNDFTGSWLKDHERILGALLSCDARIEPVRFRPEEFCDENPLVWEIKTKGVRLL